jgi:hypothetical protein
MIHRTNIAICLLLAVAPGTAPSDLAAQQSTPTAAATPADSVDESIALASYVDFIIDADPTIATDVMLACPDANPCTIGHLKDFYCTPSNFYPGCREGLLNPFGGNRQLKFFREIRNPRQALPVASTFAGLVPPKYSRSSTPPF